MTFRSKTISSLIALWAVSNVQACQFHDAAAAANIDFDSIAAQNNHYGAIRRSIAANETAARIVAIKNVHVYDGYTLNPSLSTVVINGSLISHSDIDDCGIDEVVDGRNGTLMPGLIENHAHPTSLSHLEDLARYGVTTVINAACYSIHNCLSLQNHTGLPSVILASAPAAAPGSAHGNITASVNATLLVRDTEQAQSWVADQVAWGPAFVKLIAETPGLSQDTLTALVQAAQDHDKRTVCHATAFSAYEQAIAARAEQIHHTPLDSPPTSSMAQQMAYQNQISVPTLAIMRAIADKVAPGVDAPFNVALETVRRVREAHVPVLAGTDANLLPGLIAMVPFGISLHEELGLLVQAGLEPVEALRGATSRAAFSWGLRDRGVIAPGKRADLVLVDGDPTVDIGATNKLVKVWLDGTEWKDQLGTF